MAARATETTPTVAPPETDAPEGAAPGLPVQGIQFAQAAWLKDDAKHLLPEGAHKATKDQHVAAAKAAAAAARSGNPR